MKIPLNRDETRVAYFVAQLRNRLAGDDHPNYTGGSANDHLRDQFMACMAEIGTSKALNMYWSGCGKQTKDVGFFLEVRSVEGEQKGLLVRPKDDPLSPYMLVQVYVEDRVVELLGWAYGSDVIRDGIKHDADSPFPYWVLNREALHPLSELRLPLIEALAEVAV